MSRIQLSGGRRRRRFLTPWLLATVLVLLVAAVVVAAVRHRPAARHDGRRAAVSRIAVTAPPVTRPPASRHRHPRVSPGLRAERLTAHQVEGVPPARLFRPPYGAYDRVTLSTLHRLHMLMVMWSVDPGDWRRPGSGTIVADVLRKVRPGAIVILHDGGGDRTQTIAALPAIIRALHRRRY